MVSCIIKIPHISHRRIKLFNKGKNATFFLKNYLTLQKLTYLKMTPPHIVKKERRVME